jgi:hypothetical protein
MLFCDLRTGEILRSSCQGISLIAVNLYCPILDPHSNVLTQTGYLCVDLKFIPGRAYVL